MLHSFVKTAAALAIGSASTVLAHSWVDSTKYDPVSQNSLGYARGYPGRSNPDINTEYTYLFSGSPASQPMCNPKQQANMNYSPLFPMATVQPGETVYTSWEQNGHLNNTNPTKIDILYYPDPNKQFVDVSERNTAMVAGTMDFATDANCYSPGNPNSVCFGSWTVPKDLKPGNVYHFVWFWYFDQNPAGEWYSTCFDLNVQESSHVVEIKPMAELVAMPEPNLQYALGMTDSIKKEIEEVTNLGEGAQSEGSYSSEPPAESSESSAEAVEPPAETVESPAETAESSATSSEVVEQPTSSAPAPTPAKCRPRPH